MARLAVLCLALFAGLSQCEDVRIAGGRPVDISVHPSIVQVETPILAAGIWVHVCAGNVLNNRYILSAAHCFSGSLYDIIRRRVRAGTSIRNSGGAISYIMREINHPSYGLRGNDGDITVVELLEGFFFSPFIQQATIISQGFTLPGNQPVIYAGWGRTSEYSGLSDVLRDVSVYSVDNEVCRNQYLSLPDPILITENMICAGLLNSGGADACDGDGGGPLYFSDILVGVVSWSQECGNGTYPSVSTAVSSYTDWIVVVVG